MFFDKKKVCRTLLKQREIRLRIGDFLKFLIDVNFAFYREYSFALIQTLPRFIITPVHKSRKIVYKFQWRTITFC